MKLEKQQWTLAKKCTKESRVQLLHWKILHNTYPAGIPHKMGIRSSNKCQFCDEIDYLEHFFWYCKKVRSAFPQCTHKQDYMLQ